MSAEEELRDGDPDAALAQLQERVRQDPSNVELRVFLFQLLAVLGQWDRAMTQLNVAGNLDAETLAMVHTYREALRCERLRAEVFGGRHSPLVLGKPAQWMAFLMEALRLFAQGQSAQAEELRAAAFKEAPTISGTIDGQDFAWISDVDTRLGPLLEVIVNGRYYWAPFARISRIRIEEPADLRDLVWMPTQFEWANGGEAVGLIPTRYPGSEASPDSAIRMARKTEWEEHEGDLLTGLGQRLLATDANDYAIMDVRDVVLDARSEAADVSLSEKTADGAGDG